MNDPEVTGWVPQAIAGLGLSSTALGAWILRTATRQARYEQKLDDFAKHTSERLDSIDDGIQKIRMHITGADL